MRSFAVAVLAAVVLLTTGCCGIARVLCDIEPPPSPAKGSRQTADDAMNYLVEAFRDRRTHDIYDSFSPEFKRDNGNFTLAEFDYAYTKAESEFLADAGSLAAAQRHWREPRGDVVVVELSNTSTGAFFPIAFVNRPKIRIVTTDPFVKTIEGTVPMRSLIRLEDGVLKLPQTFDLVSIENARRENFAGLTMSDVLSIEFTDDWVVRSIDTEHARGIHFLDKIKEYAGK